jgi:hypothetical protein
MVTRNKLIVPHRWVRKLVYRQLDYLVTQVVSYRLLCPGGAPCL